jgi:hypothetical protein
MRARNDLQSRLNAASSELRVLSERHASTQSSLDEARAVLASLREEKLELATRVGRAEASAHARHLDSEAVEAERAAMQQELLRLQRANDSLSAQLQLSEAEVERLRSKAASAAVAADVAHYRRSASAGGSGPVVTSSVATPSHAAPSPAAASGSRTDAGVPTMLRIERGDVIYGDGVQSVVRGKDGSTTLRSHAGAEVHLSGGDSVRVDVKPAPYVAGDDWGASPRYAGVSAVGNVSTRSARSTPGEQRSPSPGVSRLQDRLRRVQATFAQLREGSVGSSFDTSASSLRM